ncbi:sugar phosphate isomerase/epimerase [Rhizobium laguerreae]|jgi:sugar phosphate isomerase/epimerase|uniref:Sugar phosphate isomerase/epimerase n=1 Tax=Rhizobium laguerreae TaxID=1076926 RepID=A0AAJ3A4B1_9HYPH|nr:MULTISPECIES: sugar phosphate isomerase/epimerase [Rhizobium]MBB3165688.1 sugar phosphate isomerase/epimerase [Rhizobium laguerreae]MBY3066904.1 sugar phosphate isomerase/epimerase [Rhizobium laguerreae]MBY3079549.1 sugar phosphate isomerase/epimerase [Rhizobium laguerreae]MBY3094883.1 sugar phosphate isomerase/epimerase [Rhizobium laguerreae]MBY3113155.1 sugar phosphate isomerase/epimerase [Rhizobium laguerreae]
MSWFQGPPLRPRTLNTRSPPSISLQLHSMRGLGSLACQVEAAAAVGYQFVEPLEHHLVEAEGLDRILRDNAVAAPTAHVTLATFRAETARTVDNCIRCGVRELFVQIPNNAAIEKVAYWQKTGTELGKHAEIMLSHGVTLGFHNVNSGFRLLPNGQYGFEVLFRAASGSPLVWQADIAWLHRAGVNPRDWLRRFSGLLTSAHVKDQAADGESIDEDGWANVGAGVMVWPSLWQAAVQNGARTLVIEHDNPKDPVAFAKKSLSYVQRFL